MITETWKKVYNFNNQMSKDLHILIHEKTGNGELMIIHKSRNNRLTGESISMDKIELIKMAESIIKFYKGDV